MPKRSAGSSLSFDDIVTLSRRQFERLMRSSQEAREVLIDTFCDADPTTETGALELEASTMIMNRVAQGITNQTQSRASNLAWCSWLAWDTPKVARRIRDLLVTHKDTLASLSTGADGANMQFEVGMLACGLMHPEHVEEMEQEAGFEMDDCIAMWTTKPQYMFTQTSIARLYHFTNNEQTARARRLIEQTGVSVNTPRIHIVRKEPASDSVELYLPSEPPPRPNEASIEQGVPRCWYAWCPLQLAVYNHDVNTAQMLIENKANLDVCNEGPTSPLALTFMGRNGDRWRGCPGGFEKMMRLLIDAGADTAAVVTETTHIEEGQESTTIEHMAEMTSCDFAVHLLAEARRKRCWTKARQMVRCHGICMYWMKETAEKTCAPGGANRLRDLVAFKRDFG